MERVLVHQVVAVAAPGGRRDRDELRVLAVRARGARLEQDGEIALEEAVAQRGVERRDLGGRGRVDGDVDPIEVVGGGAGGSARWRRVDGVPGAVEPVLFGEHERGAGR